MPNGSPYQQKSAKSKTRAGGVFKLLGYLAVLAIIASGWVFAYQLKKAKTQVSEELADVKGRADEMFKTLGKMQEDVSSKKRELLKVEDKYKGQIKDIKSDFHDGLERLSTMEQREQALMDDSQRLRTFIQMQSKLDTVEKYVDATLISVILVLFNSFVYLHKKLAQLCILIFLFLEDTVKGPSVYTLNWAFKKTS